MRRVNIKTSLDAVAINVMRKKTNKVTAFTKFGYPFLSKASGSYNDSFPLL